MISEEVLIKLGVKDLEGLVECGSFNIPPRVRYEIKDNVPDRYCLYLFTGVIYEFRMTYRGAYLNWPLQSCVKCSHSLLERPKYIKDTIIPELIQLIKDQIGGE